MSTLLTPAIAAADTAAEHAARAAHMAHTAAVSGRVGEGMVIAPAVLEARLVADRGRALARHARVWVRCDWRATEVTVKVSNESGTYEVALGEQRPAALPPREHPFMLLHLGLVAYGRWWCSELLAYGDRVVVRRLVNPHVLDVSAYGCSTSGQRSPATERQFTVNFWG